MISGSYSNGLIYNSIYHLLNFEKYSSFQMAAREAAISNNFQLVLLSEDFNVLFSVETRHKASIEDAVRLWLEQGSAGEEASTQLVDVKGVATYWGSVSIAGVKHYLMLVDNEKNYSQDEIMKLAEIIELAMGMWNYLPERDSAAELIRALRRGNRGLAHTLIEELGIKAADCSAVFFIPDIGKDESLSALAAFETESSLRSIKVNDGDELAGIILNTASHSAGAEEKAVFIEHLLESGAERVFLIDLAGGIEEMCSAFQLINETEAFAGIVFPRTRRYGRFELAIISNCVNMCMKNDVVRKNFTDLLVPLSELSVQKGGQLLDTLSTYVLDAGFSAAETAALLEVHTNTVQYRLKKIKEILGAESISPAVQTGILIALAVSRLSKEVKSF